VEGPSGYNSGGANCIVDGLPTSCSTVLSLLGSGNPGAVSSAGGVTTVNLVGQGVIGSVSDTQFSDEGDVIGMGTTPVYGDVSFGLTLNTPGSSSFFGTNLDDTYGTVVGTLGTFFRGRPPGQSFGACVGQNMSLLFTGSLNHPLAASIASGLTGMAGYTLTNFKAANGIELSWYVGAYAGAVAAKYVVPTLGVGAVGAAGNAAGVAAAIGGGAGIGSLLGSAANCTSVGVGP
jgi:hypothetical protein